MHEMIGVKRRGRKKRGRQGGSGHWGSHHHCIVKGWYCRNFIGTACDCCRFVKRCRDWRFGDPSVITSLDSTVHASLEKKKLYVNDEEEKECWAAAIHDEEERKLGTRAVLVFSSYLMDTFTTSGLMGHTLQNFKFYFKDDGSRINFHFKLKKFSWSI